VSELDEYKKKSNEEIFSTFKDTVITFIRCYEVLSLFYFICSIVTALLLISQQY